ncbi:hypothetical protein C8F01DRAFT_1085586 [Mycena amicta]|nr:hypothetical protein C8F01DRAFT_1085586 [Mycena amicta]
MTVLPESEFALGGTALKILCWMRSKAGDRLRQECHWQRLALSATPGNKCFAGGLAGTGMCRLHTGIPHLTWHSPRGIDSELCSTSSVKPEMPQYFDYKVIQLQTSSRSDEKSEMPSTIPSGSTSEKLACLGNSRETTASNELRKDPRAKHVVGMPTVRVDEDWTRGAFLRRVTSSRHAKLIDSPPILEPPNPKALGSGRQGKK